MTRPKYASDSERKAALSQKAQQQMLRQWEEKRAQTGQPLGYFGQHRRVRTTRGRAANHKCTCGKRAHDWAHIHQTDPADPQNYKPMCRSCHFRYDGVIAKAKETLGPVGRSAIAHKAWRTKKAMP